MEYLPAAAFYALLAITTPLMGIYLARIFDGRRTWLHPVLGWLERLSYRVGGVNAALEMNWKQYLRALLLFNALGLVFLFVVLLLQGSLPWNPQKFQGLGLPLAFNAAASFTTNTNWQAYAGETTMSYFSDMVGLTGQNFLSAATGFCLLLVLVRGIARKETEALGNFWADLVRGVVYVLLPLSFILALVLVSQGVIANLSPYVEVKTVEGALQTIPMGPAASQVAIKQLGSNGGGFFNANSAHPFENPTVVSNFLEMLAILFLPMSLVFMYGEWINKRRHAWLLWGVMALLYFGGFALSIHSESSMEGKEARLGIVRSIAWTTMTTATSNGSVNAVLTSLSPLAGGVALFNMMVSELIFGGIGVGMISMIMYVLLTVFLAGLMVGRTPEYMGKKIETVEMFWVMLAIFIPSAMILLGTGFSLPDVNKGPHALSEILYAFTSAAQNNGSAFTSLDANTDYYNILLGVIMMVGRLAAIIPTLRIAGLLASKKAAPVSLGTFSTDTILFAVLLFFVILIVGSLTFFPLLSLGPIVEHFLI